MSKTILKLRRRAVKSMVEENGVKRITVSILCMKDQGFHERVVERPAADEVRTVDDYLYIGATAVLDEYFKMEV